jgi:hypothetical protein
MRSEGMEHSEAEKDERKDGKCIRSSFDWTIPHVVYLQQVFSMFFRPWRIVR